MAKVSFLTNTHLMAKALFFLFNKDSPHLGPYSSQTNRAEAIAASG
jgi:hypothetical protein